MYQLTPVAAYTEGLVKILLWQICSSSMAAFFQGQVPSMKRSTTELHVHIVAFVRIKESVWERRGIRLTQGIHYSPPAFLIAFLYNLNSLQLPCKGAEFLPYEVL